jgi:hypothetical protein
MTETAVRRRAPWLAATVHSVRSETSVARTIVLDVPGWPGHVAGQHADVKLTAPDGYSAQRSYSIAAPADGDRVELTVQRVEDGEVSPYLVDELLPRPGRCCWWRAARGSCRSWRWSANARGPGARRRSRSSTRCAARRTCTTRTTLRQRTSTRRSCTPAPARTRAPRGESPRRTCHPRRTPACTCAGCGTDARFAESHVYDQAPGIVARCASCESVIARIVRTPTDAWLDLRGARSVRIPLQAG